MHISKINVYIWLSTLTITLIVFGFIINNEKNTNVAFRSLELPFSNTRNTTHIYVCHFQRIFNVLMSL